jgi:hypothetical protein
MDKILRTALGLLLLAMASISQCPAEPAKSMYVLTQQEDAVGKCLVYVYPDGVKVSVTMFGCQVLAKAPDWKVHCFNPTEKIEWIGDISQFGGVVMANPFAVPEEITDSKLKAVGTGNLRGLAYIKYRTPESALDAIYGTTDILSSPKVPLVITRLYAMPNPNHVPLYRCVDKGPDKVLKKSDDMQISMDASNDMRGGLSVRLKTESWKKLPFNSAEFELPHGFKRVKDLVQVTYSSGKKDDLTEIFTEVGFKSNKPQGKSR